MIRNVKFANNITHDDGTTTVAVVVEMDKDAIERLSLAIKFEQAFIYGDGFTSEMLDFAKEILHEAVGRLT